MSTAIQDGSDAPVHLAIRELRFRYSATGEELFQGLSFDFVPGTITAISGESGRGKSTLLYIVGLLLRPSEGDVLLGEGRLGKLSDRQASRVRARHFGFVFQDGELDPARPVIDSVMEPGIYAGIGHGELEERALLLLEQFGLAERARHRPGQVSGGQAQRVALCRALVNDPQVILADEPTGNLDPRNAAGVVQALREAANQGRTIVVATHDPAVIAEADQTVQL